MTLEIASEIYQERMHDMGNVITLSITSGSDEPQYPPLRMGINGDLFGGMRAPIEVGKRRIDVACVNPSPIVTMAYRGKGFFKEKLPLRALAVLPSWDKIAFAVARDSNIDSLSEVIDNKIPLRIATRSSGVDNTTYHTLSAIFDFYGMTFQKLTRWGCKLYENAWPSSQERKALIEKRRVDAIFDEGVKSWLPLALDNGYRVLPLDKKLIKHMEGLGFRASVIPKKSFKGLEADVETIDFSGWPLITHRWMGDDMAYAICAAMDARRKTIPVDDKRPLNMRTICRDTEAGPIGIPFHPGAKRYYEEKGYLRD